MICLIKEKDLNIIRVQSDCSPGRIGVDAGVESFSFSFFARREPLPTPSTHNHPIHTPLNGIQYDFYNVIDSSRVHGRSSDSE